MGVHTRRCVNFGCRVMTFLATHDVALSTCPVCQTSGVIIQED